MGGLYMGMHTHTQRDVVVTEPSAHAVPHLTTLACACVRISKSLPSFVHLRACSSVGVLRAVSKCLGYVLWFRHGI